MSKDRIREVRYYDTHSLFYPEERHRFFWFKEILRFGKPVFFYELKDAQDFLKARMLDDKKNTTFHKVEEPNE